jgi:hypothetical protein
MNVKKVWIGARGAGLARGGRELSYRDEHEVLLSDKLSERREDRFRWIR